MHANVVAAAFSSAECRSVPPSPPYDARAVANFVLDIAENRDIRLTQVSLQKILYFSHGWYLAAHAKPLLSHEFEAWQYGPVLKVVRDAFKRFGAAAISDRATRLILTTGQHEHVSPILAQSDAVFVQSIFDAYHVFDAWQLSDMTHEKGSPWDRLWNASAPIGRLALRIRNEDIRAHFIAMRTKVPVS